ncbi:hypothetical protein ATE92_1775 [Ulvibacter sp. MAR_2010_11]|uniref:hypothetical protein n=1 Tax=Ulvibacter sp. MAR_2010_11 TaxID=1250229 RepID=UPI000C2CA49C|nr:hypothetical protein [Ulvibacter sp. MAR_2010_11]PKA83615.1 hypothetical protein ATE92_1775 [Ulvibacter sp. MAR_2010_11]
MVVSKWRHSFTNFLNNTRPYPILAAVGAGLYPYLFYFSNNFELVNSWSHVGYFTLIFLLVPAISFFAASRIFATSALKKWQTKVLTCLNFFFFLFFLKLAFIGEFKNGITLLVAFVAVVLALLFSKYYKRIIIIQLLLAVVAFFYLVPKVISQVSESSRWMEQPDAIEAVVLVEKPNIYLIQPDGYTNFSELKKGYYKLEDNTLESFLVQEKFTLYPGFRSNYASTLTSNSSLFAMKHHYYHRSFNFTESLNAREVIVASNPVLSILQNNDYSTYYLAERPYLLVNRPVLGYDFSNYLQNEVEYITTGISEKKDILPFLEEYLNDSIQRPKFFFIELFSPGHIAVTKQKSEGIEAERDKWIERMHESNMQQEVIISNIKKHDPKALIIVLADHGGFVGMEYMHEAYQKTDDINLINSIFSSNLAIYWQGKEVPLADEYLKSSVNLFRILISYLSQNTSLLNNLQEDGSYIPITNGAPKGVYQYIDANSEIQFEKYNGK